MKKNLESFNEMIDRVFLDLWKRKTRGHSLEQEYFKNFPIHRFDVHEIARNILKDHKLSNVSSRRIIGLLSDLKSYFYFMLSVTDYFYVGAAKIVGNSNYDEVNLNTFSLLQGNHYKVYLISISYETLLDLFELILFNELSDQKKNKWGKKFDKLSGINNFNFITNNEHEKMICFRDNIRRAEIHGFSSVVRHLDKDKWNHFQEEENVIKSIFAKLSDKYN